MTPSNKSIGSAILASLAIVIGFSFAASAVRAEDGPSKADLQNLEDIKANQKILDQDRPAYERFVQAKTWNEAEVRELNANGWNVDWSTMKLVPLEQGF